MRTHDRRSSRVIYLYACADVELCECVRACVRAGEEEYVCKNWCLISYFRTITMTIQNPCSSYDCAAVIIKVRMTSSEGRIYRFASSNRFEPDIVLVPWTDIYAAAAITLRWIVVYLGSSFSLLFARKLIGQAGKQASNWVGTVSRPWTRLRRSCRLNFCLVPGWLDKPRLTVVPALN